MGVPDATSQNNYDALGLPGQSPTKRRRIEPVVPARRPRRGGKNVVDLTAEYHENDEDEAATKPAKRKPRRKTGTDEEKRLRVWRKKAPQSYLQKLERATSQRHVMIFFLCITKI
ncbi:MAG: hypothetical protein LQ340_007690 [Diploschistes diacapsis]|nr:MAG: hypothetical protein LQ340_007690 [Diploschistes diacapsis]